MQPAARQHLDRLHRHEAEAVAAVAAVLASVKHKARPYLAAVTLAVAAARRDGVNVTPAWVANCPAWLALLELLRRELATVPDTVATQVQQVMVDAAGHAAAVTETPRVVPGTTSSADVVGRMNGWVRDILTRMPAVIADGTPAQTVVRDGLDAVGFHAGTQIRTEQMTTYRDGLRAGWGRSGLVHGWVWVCVADQNTCGACWAMNGTVHPLSEQLDGHPRCRCTMAPLHQMSPGPLPARITDPEASFDRLPAAAQYDILGPGKYAAHQQGLLTVDDHPDTGVVRVHVAPDGRRRVTTRPLYDIVGADRVPDLVRAGIAAKPA